jgi:hypothetical protein
MSRAPQFSVLCIVLALSGCNCPGSGNGDGGAGHDGGGGDGGVSLLGLQSMTLSPANATLAISGATPATATYTALGTFSDGHTADITAATAFSLADSTLGSFSGNAFTSTTNQGGVTEVQGTAGQVTGGTPLTLSLAEQYNDPGSTGLPPNPGGKFAGPPTGTAPDIVYPNDGVLLPPNLGRLEIHFMPGAGNTLFEMSFENALTDVKVFMTCATPLNGGCIYMPDPKVWAWIARTNRGGTPLAVTVKGTDANGTAVGSSTPVNISFSYDDINGGLYYWTTSNNTAIMRFDFASSTQTAAAKFADPTLTGGTCVGCHALSRDGTRMVAEAGGQNDGRLLLMDVATGAPLVPFPASGKSIFESWNPDGGAIVGVYGDNGATDYNLLLFTPGAAAPGTPADIPGTGSAANPADHPDWSADGTKIAYVKVGNPGTMQRMWTGAIQMISSTASGWSTPVELVPSVAGKNHYYPSFAPDSTFLLFDESTCATPGTLDITCDADTDMSATLFAVPATTGATPVVLTAANEPGKMDNGNTQLTNSFPKWSPFVFRRTFELGAPLMWVTFSSTRKFGLRSPPAGGTENPSGTFIWMTAIDPTQVAQGQDPSYPAFCLPFQDFTTSNHIAQWTTQVVGVIQ